jgi:hypothetical protein
VAIGHGQGRGATLLIESQLGSDGFPEIEMVHAERIACMQRNVLDAIVAGAACSVHGRNRKKVGQ